MLAYTRKPKASPLPRISSSYALTIEVNGWTNVYLEFWHQGFLGRVSSPELDEASLQELMLDYFVRAEPSKLSKLDLHYFYTATLRNDSLAPLCLTLQQTHTVARLRLVVRGNGKCSFVIGTTKEAAAFLSQYFDGVQEITERQFASVDEHLMRPKQLTKLVLPALRDVDDAFPLPFRTRCDPPAADAVIIGEVLSPISLRPVGPATTSLADLAKHLFVAGSNGSGKTNTVMQTTIQVHGRVPILIFDVKREHRALAKLIDARVYGFRGTNLCTMNLLKPPSAPDQWIKEFAAIFSEVISRNVPATGSKDVIIEELDRLFREREIYNGGRDFPHIADLAAALEERGFRTQSDREKNWIASALRVLKTLCVGSTRDAFCVTEGLALERFLEGANVIETEGIGDPAGVALVTTVLLQKLRNHFLDQYDRDKLKLLVVLEEAQNVLARGAEANSFLAAMCRELRGLGVGLVYVTQVPSEFSKHALANVNTIIAHKLVLPEDKAMMADILGLDGKQAVVLEQLKVGEAILRTSDSVLIKVPHVERPIVRDGDLQRVLAKREEVSASPAHRTEVSIRMKNLDPRDLRLFLAIATGDAIYPTELTQKLGYGYSDTKAGLQKLTRLGLIGFRPGKRRGAKPRILYFLRPYGEEAYRALESRYPDRKTVRSPNHAELVAHVVRILGIAAESRGRFDLVYKDGDVKRAIEVETGSNKDEQLRENVSKCIALQGYALFAVADDRTRNRVLQAAARLCFDTRQPIELRVATIDDLAGGKGFDTFLLPWLTLPSTPSE